MEFDKLMMNFRHQVQLLMSDTDTQFATNWEADMAALAIAFVGCCCVVAMFHRAVRDTVLERIAFAGMALGAFSRAMYIFGEGAIPLDGAWLCYSLAFYCAVLIWKYAFVIPHRPDYKEPEDMPDY